MISKGEVKKKKTQTSENKQKKPFYCQLLFLEFLPLTKHVFLSELKRKQPLIFNQVVLKYLHFLPHNFQT